jgi:hypothetical protein
MPERSNANRWTEMRSDRSLAAEATTVAEKQDALIGAAHFDSMVAGARYIDWKQTGLRSNFAGRPNTGSCRNRNPGARPGFVSR